MRRALLLVFATACACTPAFEDEPDAGIVDAGTNFDFCHELSIADCDVVGCARMRGILEDDHCGARTTETELLACQPADAACDDALACGVRPEDGARFTFFSTCIPRGWQPCTVCEDFEFCETNESNFDVCVDDAASCDDLLAEWDDRFRDVIDATSTCARDLDCTTESVRFLCGTGEVYVQGCVVPIAHDLACEYRQAVEDLEVELCTGRCIPDECGFVAQCVGPIAVACVEGRCAFAP